MEKNKIENYVCAKKRKKYNKKSRIRTGVKKNERFSTDMILKKK
jgi:hypothetical protein